MNKYIEREALYKFCKDQLEEETGAYSKGRNAGLRVAMSAAMNNDAIPAADVRPVIYCKECKHRPSKEYGRIIAPKDDGYTDYKCPFVCEDSWYNRMPADDDYCSCGEKSEES